MKKIFLHLLIAGIIAGTWQDSKPQRQEVVLPDQYISMPAK